MVRTYKRRTNRGTYDKNQLREAVLAVRNGTLSGYKAAQVYKIPRMTIMDHVHKKRSSNMIGRKTTLPSEVEMNLASCLHIMETYGFGLTRAEVLDMVGEYIKQNNIPSSFKNGVPGKDWFVSFSKRHHLSIKKPQAVEYARKTAIDPYIVFPYFDLLEKTIKELNLQDKPHAIWNLDETSFSKDPSKTKIVGVKGYAATRVIATPGKDNTTVLLGASAAGQKTPPLIIFKGKNVWDEWTSPDAYPGTTYAATKNGWMESEVFEAFFKKTFLPAIGNQRPVLLIYDGHSTHVGLNIIEEARRANVTILKIPPHTSHVLQPLDVSVMKSFKDQWDRTLVQWQRLNVGKPLEKKDFSRLIGSIWTKINPQVLRNGFRKTGIYPINRNEIEERLFDPLQLKRWQQYLLNSPTQSKKEPQKLLCIALNCIKNHFCRNEQENLSIDLAEDNKISFEELLLLKVKRSENISKPKRRKVAPGAEVITHDDVLKFKKDEQNSKKNIKRKIQSNMTNKNTDDVVLLSNLSRDNSQSKPFTALNSQDLPDCFQNHELDTPKVKITSNVIIKAATKLDEDRIKPGPSGLKPTRKTKIINQNATSIQISAKKIVKTSTFKGKGIGKKSKGKENKELHLEKTDDNLHHSKYAKVIKRKKQISRSSSTTSVSGSCSSHSDSDIVNVSTDYEYNDDVFLNMPMKVPDFESHSHHSQNLLSKIECNEKTEINKAKNSSLRLKLRNARNINKNDMNLKTTKNVYSVNDHVLVRYYNRNKWTYYVGIIQNNYIQGGEIYYSVRFYKTIKKPKLLFKMTKRVDQDNVPDESILKKVNLHNDEQLLNCLVLSCEDDELYFN
ncbi:unnamed protein product [Euphydryas editha]|uniref:Transposase n=1 Tax=Euphydryas editha TaxID=104508 RepID=A0AAU9UE83_EUPED|nr:unnamed protein product [Euphydryas editha]